MKPVLKVAIMLQSELLFRAENIHKSFGSTRALKGVGLELHRGEVLGLMGENGSGKSTLTSIIAAIQKEDEGTRFHTIFSQFIPMVILTIALFVSLALTQIVGHVYINNLILHPLTQLSAEVRAYTPGKTGVLRLDTNDEISDLCQDFHRMMEKVNRQVEDIKDKERQNALTQYRLLATQLDPHFVYNTMSLINALASQGDCAGVIRINTALIHLLRERINTRATIVDRIDSEIQTLEEYLRIMAYRYGDAVSVNIDVDPHLRACQVPKNLLQPLVENAFLHGLTDENGVCRGSIGILIYELQEKIVIEVSDDGKGMSRDCIRTLNQNLPLEPEHSHTHIGFDNLRQRLEYIYGSEFKITVYSVEQQGSTITIVLPKHPPAE